MVRLNAHQLEVFVAVARVGNMTRAANELFISQPSVSEQIKEMERACGLPLLERQPRGVRLTHAGEVVYRYAECLSTAAEELERTLGELRTLIRGRLRIGASMTIGQYILPKVMGEFQQLYPGVELSLAVGTSTEILDQVVGHDLGLGFVGGAPSHRGLAVVPYLVDEIVVIMDPGHELASRPSLSVQDLTGAKWIAREQGSATRSEAEHCLQSAGVRLVPAMELGSNEAVKSAVSAGLGFGLISRLDVAAEAAAGQVVVRTIADWNCRRLFCICYRRSRRLSQAERAFLQFLECEPDGRAASPAAAAGEIPTVNEPPQPGHWRWDQSGQRFSGVAVGGGGDHAGGTG